MDETGHTATDEMKGLGANERALLERIRFGPLRRLAIRMVHVKMRLQFTGWLQYLLPVPFVLGLGLLGGIAALLGGWRIALAFWVPAGLVTVGGGFDVVTTKWRIRPAERRPPTLEGLEPFDLLRARHSCRSFQTRPMRDEDREAVLAAGRTELARPTIGAIVPRLEYIAAPLTVWPTVNASEFLVAIVPAAYDRVAVIDLGRVLQRVVVRLTRLGIATCWIGPGADPRSVAAHLGEGFDPRRDHMICVCAVGYRSAYVPLFIRVFNREMSTHRRPLSQLFFADRAMSRPLDVTAPPFARFGRTFEACRWAPSSYNGQTTRAVLETGPDGEVTGVHFFAATSSRYYAPVALGIWCADWELGCAAVGEHGTFEVAPPPADEHAVPRHDITWRPA